MYQTLCSRNLARRHLNVQSLWALIARIAQSRRNNLCSLRQAVHGKVMLPLATLILAGAGLSPLSRCSAQEVDHAFDFERVVRPILVAKCFECHADGNAEAGLVLTRRQSILEGGESGSAFDSEHPAQSLLLRAVKREGGLEMPPDTPLRASELEAIEAWIMAGMPWPETPPDATVRTEFSITKEDREHWSFRPVTRPTPPSTQSTQWSLNPIDAFVAAAQSSVQLQPSPRADRRTLLRRLSFDLTGLPPDDENLRLALQDSRPDEVVLAREADRLMASPRYGERWGRHWLDVARYADTKDGVLMFGDDRMRPYAYTYRDYVIRAFNEDLPYDQFVIDQLAADLSTGAEEPWRLGALGFLTLGRMYDNNIHDIIDDQIDVVTRGFLGLTVTCARCHDHKYDPISMADYYSLYGILANSEAPLELPRIDRDELSPETEQVEATLTAKRNEITQFVDEQYHLLSQTARERTSDYLIRVATKPADPLETAIFFLSLAPTDLRPQIVHRWRYAIEQSSTSFAPVFAPWHSIREELESESEPTATDLATRVEQLLVTLSEQQPSLNPWVLTRLKQAGPSDMESVARVYGELLIEVWKIGLIESEEERANQIDRMTQELGGTNEAYEQLVRLMIGPEAPAHFPRSQARKYMSREQTDRFGGLNIELDRIATQNPKAVSRAMVVYDKSETPEPRIFSRGNPSLPGSVVERRFLELCDSCGPREMEFQQGSGRLALARAIADRNNPLTPRVIVNRLWLHHFDDALVSSPSDFGRRTQVDPNGELLDWLANQLFEDEWSIKRIHLRIVLSQTYAQSAEAESSAWAYAMEVDPDNRRWWQHRLKRLEFEAMRDAMFAVSETLDFRMGGRPQDLTSPSTSVRSVYGLVDRQNLPGLFRVFDFASPDVSVGRRPRTLVAQQALFALNSPLMLTKAQDLADFVLRRAHDDEARIRLMVWRVWQRDPSDDERRWMLEYVQAPVETDTSADSWQRLAQVLLSSSEFLYLD